MKTRIAGLAVLGLLCFAALGRAAESQADWTVTLKVKMTLLDKLGTDALHVNVDTIAGKVQLSGTVGKRETKELASEIARSVQGVAGVDNDLRVEAQVVAEGKDPVGAAASEAANEVKDGLLESKVRLALIDKLGSDGLRIGTEAASGVVTLEFDAAMPRARRLEAEAVVREVAGVTKVISVDKR